MADIMLTLPSLAPFQSFRRHRPHRPVNSETLSLVVKIKLALFSLLEQLPGRSTEAYCATRVLRAWRTRSQG